MENNNSRRIFLKTFALGAAALMIAPVLKIRDVVAELVNPETEPVAKALGYVPDVEAINKEEKAKKVKPADSKLKGRVTKADYCKGCQYFGDATGKAKQSPCTLMGGKDVMGTGWCRSFSMRAKTGKKA